jgi:hypothetical protein
MSMLQSRPLWNAFTAPALRTIEEFQKLKAGDTVAMVCTQCSSITVKTLGSEEEAMALCKEGEHVVCGSCEKTTKVVRHGPRSKGGQDTEVGYVNDKGEDCMFVTKLNE